MSVVPSNISGHDGCIPSLTERNYPSPFRIAELCCASGGGDFFSTQNLLLKHSLYIVFKYKCRECTSRRLTEMPNVLFSRIITMTKKFLDYEGLITEF